MSKILALADQLHGSRTSGLLSSLHRTLLGSRPIRYMVSLTALLLTTCDSLWTQFRETNPINCLLNPGICPEGQVCNSQTRLCGVPQLTLIAGAIGGPGNADDTGVDARLNGPYGVAADGAGNLYVADTDNHTIRKVVLSTGAVTTIAGTAGMSGSTDGTGTAARFLQPLGLTVDGAGNLFVADTHNDTIRKVELSTGAVTTIAGTDDLGTKAQFLRPYGVVSDGTGNLYVADTYNHTIRKVVLSTSTVTTIVGTAGTTGSDDGTGAAARLRFPSSVVPDGAGNLYVADSNNHTIRKVVLSTGAVSTIVGTAGVPGYTDGAGAAARFSYPSGVATDGAGNLYVSDNGNKTIRKVVLSTGTVTTIAGTAGIPGHVDGTGATAQFSRPFGVTTDGAGNLYIADRSTHTIRKVVLSTSVVTTVAGRAAVDGSDDGTGAAAQFKSPAGVAVDAAGNLYVADISNHTIRKIVASTGTVTTVAGTAGMSGNDNGTGIAARFNEPTGIALDGTGNLFVADYRNHTIRKIVLNSGVVTTIAGAAGKTGSKDAAGAEALFNLPNDVVSDRAGNLYVTDLGNSTVRMIESGTGTVRTIAGLAGMTGSVDGKGPLARFYSPSGAAIDDAGNLFVAESGNHTIRKIALANQDVTTIAGTAGLPGSADGGGSAARFYYPGGVAIDRAGNLYVADTGNHTVRKIQLPSALVTTIAGVAAQGGIKLGMLPARLNTPYGVGVLPTKEIIIADGAENAILALR